jgi:ketol-acid reductoisomerase
MLRAPRLARREGTEVSAGLEGVTVAVVGFGSQGTAQALNLRDSGLTVIVGARAGGASAARAAGLGFDVRTPAEAVRASRVAAMLIPDEAVPAAWGPIAAALPSGSAVVFAHGFSLLYGQLAVPAALDVVLVSPTGPGPAFRGAYERGETLPAYIAVHQDGTGAARETARAYARQVGCGPLVDTTVREETEVDLFGEQTVLCGGLNALVAAAFETLVDRGYSPQVAYLECVHQLKYLADLLHQRGVAGFRQAISGTALYGDVTRGPRVIGRASRAAMGRILDEIQSGAFAREWLAESAAGRPALTPALAAAALRSIEAARRKALGLPPGEAGNVPRER